VDGGGGGARGRGADVGATVFLVIGAAEAEGRKVNGWVSIGAANCLTGAVGFTTDFFVLDLLPRGPRGTAGGGGARNIHTALIAFKAFACSSAISSSFLDQACASRATSTIASCLLSNNSSHMKSRSRNVT
ncbi:hypothetical protein DL95DRAFT_396119, partial [Leptodontidium sp. 2 PMI_412]